MGNNPSAVAGNGKEEQEYEEMMARVLMVSDFVYHMNHMETYGCGDEFRKALRQCNPEYLQGGAARDDDACAKATAALRRCMEAEPAAVHFQAYVRAMDQGLAEDERRAKAGEPPLSWWDAQERCFRWWNGMKRSS